jgi:4-hydroxy-tetrahydrodipicolinate synthase
MTKLPLEGSIVALATPFRDGALDEKAYRALCEWQLASGTDGLVPCGTTGEAVTLSSVEQLACVEIAVEVGHAAGKPVLAGAGSNSTAKTVEQVQAMREAGADAALVVTPYYNKPTQAGLVAHYREVARRVPGFPLVAYNVPGRTGCDLLPDTYEALAGIEEVVAVKEATGNLVRLVEIFERVGDRFAMLSGDDPTIAPFCLLGGKGVISVSANVVPRQVADLVRAARTGDTRRARELQVDLQCLHRALFVESNPIPVKAALHLLGRFADEVRLPLTPATAATRQKLREALSGLGVQVAP